MSDEIDIDNNTVECKTCNMKATGLAYDEMCEFNSDHAGCSHAHLSALSERFHSLDD